MQDRDSVSLYIAFDVQRAPLPGFAEFGVRLVGEGGVVRGRGEEETLLDGVRPRYYGGPGAAG